MWFTLTTLCATALLAQTYTHVGETTGSTLAVSSTLISSGPSAGTVMLFGGVNLQQGAGRVLPYGQSLDRNEYSALFGVLGTTYGAMDGTVFGVPNIAGRTVLGTSGALGGMSEDAISLRYGIATSGVYPTSGTDGVNGSAAQPFLGQIFATTAPTLPAGWAAADGQLLNIDDHAALFNLLGTTYGGDGITTFALPNLIGRAPIGNSGTNPVGTTTSSTVTITYAITASGVYPTGGVPAGDNVSYVADVLMFAFGDALLPTGLVEANGQLAPVSQNSALYSLLLTTYGGDGITTFGLPDFQDRTFISEGVSAMIPEPGTTALLLGLAGWLGAVCLRRRRANR